MKPRLREASPLGDHWHEVAARVQSSSRIALFVDFDGTLVPIVKRPDQVRLAASMRHILQRLGQHPRVTVIVVSGRRRHELLRYIGLRGLRYFGLYGGERAQRSTLPVPVQTALDRARARLQAVCPSVPGLWIENKRLSLCVHYLDVPAKEQVRARRKVRAALLPFRTTLRIFENLRDAEIVPRGNPDKGATVRQFLDRPAFSKALPFYFGDDLSDESAFAAVRKGISVRIGQSRPTQARYSLRDPNELAAVLKKLAAVLVIPRRKTRRPRASALRS